jgi:hypothetical protein
MKRKFHYLIEEGSILIDKTIKNLVFFNLLRNIHEAFTRRMHFTVDFPFFDDEYRLKIWQNIFPKQIPLSEDMDFEFLAKRFKISGGSIKNIALRLF